MVAPLEGKFFLTKNAQETPLKVGDKVKKGDLLCYIEAMKTYNAIRADFDGTVTAICATPGDTISEDDVLMKIGHNAAWKIYLEDSTGMTAFSNIIEDPSFLVMYAIAFILLYLGIKKHYEPLLLVPIAFGVLIANFPGGEMGVIQADENGMVMVNGVLKSIWKCRCMKLHTTWD